MNDDRGLVLLALARASITSALGQTCFADQSAPWLREKGACFVTLKQGGELRGCVGHIEPRHSLLEAVTAAALAAALEDPRFPPLSVSELAITHIDVSQLSALEPMAALSEEEALEHIRPQIDGLLLESGRHRGIFLPQVWDSAPNARDFLGLLKLKAGLPPDFWSNEIRLHRFQVVKYSEPEIGRPVH
jgi:AmmeMemoRadiSam system protein A